MLLIGQLSKNLVAESGQARDIVNRVILTNLTITRETRTRGRTRDYLQELRSSSSGRADSDRPLGRISRSNSCKTAVGDEGPVAK